MMLRRFAMRGGAAIAAASAGAAAATLAESRASTAPELQYFDGKGLARRAF